MAYQFIYAARIFALCLSCLHNCREHFGSLLLLFFNFLMTFALEFSAVCSRFWKHNSVFCRWIWSGFLSWYGQCMCWAV